MLPRVAVETERQWRSMTEHTQFVTKHNGPDDHYQHLCSAVSRYSAGADRYVVVGHAQYGRGSGCDINPGTHRNYAGQRCPTLGHSA